VHKGTDADMVRTRLKTLGLNNKIIKEILKVSDMVAILANCSITIKTAEGVIAFNNTVGIHISHQGKVAFHRLKPGVRMDDIITSYVK
jgi:hypothetical protein